ncbi:MAG: relaxase/mobilization nuclease domain-containing protein [Bdellovibrionaceae bacterium]|nr:relaxase/mobilization nuclease domain-containing protein [Pseudobdellovibrionaceae bacterium]
MRSLQGYNNYTLKDRGEEISQTPPEDSHGEMVAAIKDEHQRLGNKLVEHEAYTIYQSWHEKESNLFSTEKYNQMGRELAERFAPGHLAWVTTHTDKKHIHNHITICSVHTVTGKALDHSFDSIKGRLHEINNDIARQNGLTVNRPRTNDIYAKLPDGARKMLQRGKTSWLLDMIEKIDFARAGSTSFDEYVGQLKMLGVDAHVENKNISYFYGKRTKPVRGKKLGTQFDRDGLMKAFKENDEKFAKHPGLRDQIRTDIRSAFDSKGNAVGTPSDLLLKSASHPGLRNKNYGEFTKIPRSHARSELPSDFDERGGALYLEMKRAKQTSILDYCEKHKIKTKTDDKGRTVLAGREFVVLGEREWTNTKNYTKGNIIDFVSIHDNVSFLRAVAKLNNNPRLLLLEQITGEMPKGFKAFHIPKPRAAAPERSSRALRSLLESRSVPEHGRKAFALGKNAHAGVDGSVWLMNEKGDAALEFRDEPGAGWRAKRHGNPVSVFHESTSKSKKLAVFANPFEFALFKAQTRDHSLMNANVLVFFSETDSDRRLNEFLALHTHVTEVHLAQSSKGDRRERDRQTFHEVKRRLDPFNIEVKPLHLGELGKERGRGPDIEI